MGWKDRLNDLGLKDRLKEATEQATAALEKGQVKLNERRARPSVTPPAGPGETDSREVPAPLSVPSSMDEEPS
jgi:hypothetical protein